MILVTGATKHIGNVLNAACQAGARHLVYTSSIHARSARHWV